MQYKQKENYLENLTAKHFPVYPNWFSCSNVKSIIFDLLTGLKYLKAQSYVHRDLKPANLLLTDDGIVKIAIFGAPTDLEQIWFIIHQCGSINECVWNGISNISTEDPLPGFIEKDPKTGKKKYM